MQPESEARHNYSPLVLMRANQRLQTRFYPDEFGGGGGGGEGELDTNTGDDSGIEETATEDFSTEGDESQVTGEQETRETTQAVGPEEDDDRAFWNKHREGLPEKYRKQYDDLLRGYMKLEREAEIAERTREAARGQQQQPAPQPGQLSEVEEYLANEHMKWTEATVAASKAMQAGDHAAAKRASAQAGLHMSNMASVRNGEVINMTLAEIEARTRPQQIRQKFESHKDFEPIKHAAPHFARIEATLIQAGLSPEAASKMVGDAAYAAVDSRKSKSTKTVVNTEDRNRARQRSRSESPDGGGSATGDKEGGFDKASKDFWANEFGQKRR